MAKAVSAKSKKRGRPATGRDPILNLRASPDLVASLDRWIAEQREPQPSRSEAIRRLVARGIAASVRKKAKTQKPAAAIVDEIEKLKGVANALDVEGPPSPAKAMKTMKRAVVKNEIKNLKNTLSKIKGAKRT